MNSPTPGLAMMTKLLSVALDAAVSDRVLTSHLFVASLLPLSSSSLVDLCTPFLRIFLYPSWSSVSK